MGIYGRLKQISPSILKTLKENPAFVWLLLNAKWMSGLDYLQYIQSNPTEVKQLQIFEQQNPEEFKKIKVDILIEGAAPELDFHKYGEVIDFLLTGGSQEFEPQFLLNRNTDGDNLPLVNAVFGGTEMEYETGYGAVRYLTSNEVKQVAEALQEVTKKGFGERYKRASRMPNLAHYIDWTDKEMLYWLTDYYIKITHYYKDASNKRNAMLLYFT
ncbi:YfbM family protein [Trichocoleus sp. ST-U3]|uniref:DUF1877 family protein n=1 Tax=Coleofasciculus sp. FACHB-542 TaxID=2692787 RepID=UPI001683B292|nr:DUF1877 family protein [Coleofasciculus sp. FACHB-542]MBD2087186.1 DUF1877 family protein [Coleofasciculus sp. FACHB-542]